MSIRDRFAFVMSDDSGELKIVRGVDGAPEMVSPPDLDSDWILIDMRKEPETPDTD